VPAATHSAEREAAVAAFKAEAEAAVIRVKTFREVAAVYVAAHEAIRVRAMNRPHKPAILPRDLPMLSFR
jgi:hypothetical protein